MRVALNQFKSNILTQKLIWIMLLNALDGILTYISLYYNYATEENPIANLFIADLSAMLLLKILLPSLLIMISCIIIYRSGYKCTSVSKFFVNLGLIAYGFITLNHIYVLIQLGIFLIA